MPKARRVPISQASPKTPMSTLPSANAAMRVDACRFCLYTMGLITQEENRRILSRFHAWLDHHGCGELNPNDDIPF